MTYEMKLKEKYFDMIKCGGKIYEIRLNDEKRWLIDAGDIIVFKKEPCLIEKINTIVKDIIYFSSFEEMASTLPLEKVGFLKERSEDVANIYHEFYTVEDETKYGVVAIKVEKINKIGEFLYKKIKILSIWNLLWELIKSK